MFRIEIKEITKESTTIQAWVKVADTGNLQDGGAVYAYGPDLATTKTVQRDVLTQEVETLDLLAVIQAINKVKRVRRRKEAAT